MFRRTPALAALIALTACQGESTTPDGTPLSAQNRPLPVEVVQATAVDGYDQVRTYTGIVRARRSTELGFQVGGQVTGDVADVGKRVAKNEILARLDGRRLRSNRTEIASRLAQANARLAELREGPRKEVIAAARAETRRLEREEHLAKLQLERKKGLLRSDAASQEDVDIAATRLETFAAQLEGAKSRLAELLAGTRKEQLDAQTSLVASLTAQLEKIDIEIHDTELRAPFAGTIAARHVDTGTVVAIGQSAFRIVETAHLEAWVGVPMDAISRIRETKSKQLTIAGQTITPAAMRTLPELDRQTRTATIVFDLPPATAAAETIRVDELARLAVTYRVPTEGFELPLGALTESARGLWSCYVAAPAKTGDGFVIERAEVEVLHVTVDRALVRGTLTPGDRVLASGTLRVVPGQRVTPTDASTKK